MDNKQSSNINQIERNGRMSERASGENAVGSLGIATELPTDLEKTFTKHDDTTGEVFRTGNLTEAESISEARKIRFNLQDVSAQILYSFYPKGAPVNLKGFQVHHRTCTCNRFLLGNTSQVLKSQEFNKHFFGGVMSCANARTCPVCAQKINERKANEMRLAFHEAIARNLHVSLLTFTAPHHSSDSLNHLLGITEQKSKTKIVSKRVKSMGSTIQIDRKVNVKKEAKKGIFGALSDFWSGGWCTRFKKKFGIVGNIRSFELRYGVHGWHPHFHIIIFSANPLPFTNRNKYTVSSEQSQDWNDILKRWQDVCFANGLSRPNKYGMDIQDGKQAGSYITKMGSDGDILSTKNGKQITWDMADEMAKGNLKMGKTGSLSPWDFLALSVDPETSIDEQKRYRLLFLEYSRAMVRITLIKWSRGLRHYFELEKEVSDAELIELTESKADVLCHIYPLEWKYIYLHNLRSVLLDLADNGGLSAISKFIFNFKISSFKDYNSFHNEFKDRNKQSIYDDRY